MRKVCAALTRISFGRPNASVAPLGKLICCAYTHICEEWLEKVKFLHFFSILDCYSVSKLVENLQSRRKIVSKNVFSKAFRITPNTIKNMKYGVLGSWKTF